MTDTQTEIRGIVVRIPNPALVDTEAEQVEVATTTGLKLGEDVTVRGTMADGVLEAATIERHSLEGEQ